MRQINVCPSTLVDGFKDYSPKAIKTLFDGVKTTCKMDLSFDEDDKSMDSAIDLAGNNTGTQHNAENLSISGVQEKYPAILDNGKIRIAMEDFASLIGRTDRTNGDEYNHTELFPPCKRAEPTVDGRRESQSPISA